jgi:fructose-1-phosphate kinase PfkB-like protein
MSKIVTVTLKPSLDRTMMTHYLNPGYHNRTTEPTHIDPAGHGVNISRALHRMGIPTNAIILLGNDATSRAYKALIEFEKLPVTIVEREGLTHSHIIIVDTANKTETHIIE